jgi:hypothetical protein
LVRFFDLKNSPGALVLHFKVNLFVLDSLYIGVQGFVANSVNFNLDHIIANFKFGIPLSSCLLELDLLLLLSIPLPLMVSFDLSL